MSFLQLKQQVTVPEGQLGLLYRDQQFQRILTSGVYSFWFWEGNYSLQLYDTSGALKPITDEKVLDLMAHYPSAFKDYVVEWSTTMHQVGLVYQNKVLKDLLPPARQGAYWKPNKPITFEWLDITDEFTIPPSLARLILSSKDTIVMRAANMAVQSTIIPEGHMGFLEVDGQQYSILKSGQHAWWTFNRRLVVQQMDLRLQNMEINGQEILTKDRVSLRINLSATWLIQEPMLVKTALADVHDFLYRELQLALRSVVSTQTLDELLEDKNLLNQQVLTIASSKCTEYGLNLKSVGARDIILPGDMKAILAEVVEAQKKAEANLIKRREETQATRSLHNTAKVMEGNPILLRLKELEILEKITANVQNLNVYGGLDSVMHQMVHLTDTTKTP
ncbi:MAG: slipin family protein [Thiofilum sp.]|uniref:slipin family protein n=1 Tax=Thiofilum sp. TaxID=2212733 RepID=UPI0025D8A716|nr:slipin family protein [Thiofilum sp.]MBK8453843.1 slipin family protein [Thiofilum sp.]